MVSRQQATVNLQRVLKRVDCGVNLTVASLDPLELEETEEEDIEEEEGEPDDDDPWRSKRTY